MTWSPPRAWRRARHYAVRLNQSTRKARKAKARMRRLEGRNGRAVGTEARL